MLRRDQALDLLIEACPSFLAADDLHAFNRTFEEHGEPDLFIRVVAFSQHLVTLVEAGESAEWPAVATAVDQVLVEGDPEAVELIELGLIENLQNIVSHHDVTATGECIQSFLGPRGRECWQRREELWAQASMHVGDTAPTEADYDRVTDPDLRLYFRANTRALPDGRLISATDVLKQEQRALDRLRTHQRRALRWLLAGALLLGLALVLATYTLR